MPRTLRLVHRYPEAARDVLSEVQHKLPLDAFAPWVAQMLALLNHGPAAAVVLPVLERMAQQFPQRMFYSCVL